MLRRIDADEFEWYTNVDIAAGAITGNDIANVLAALLRTAERRTPNAIRADYRQSFPRTTASLGRLFTLDSLKVVPDAEGGSTVTLGIHMRPEKMPACTNFCRI